MERIILTSAESLDKQKEAISKRFKGVPKSPEHRAKIGAAHKGKPSPHRGKKLPGRIEGEAV